MSKQMLLLVPLLVLVSFTTAHAQWASDPALNNPIIRAVNNQSGQRITSDGKGGAIICWTDERVQQSSFDVYAQRIDKDGYVRWTVNGVVISSATASQSKPELMSDDAGGAIIVWVDTRDGDNDIYAQRIDSSGNILWAADGVPIAIGATNQSDAKIISDGKHGAIVTWNAGTGGFPPASKIYAHRIDASGTMVWPSQVLVSGTLGFVNAPSIASDGHGGAFIAYAHYPRPEYDVYAQRIDSSGAVKWASKGVGIATGAGTQDSPALVEDGAGNAFLAYLDWTSGSIANLQVVVLKKNGSQAASFRATSTTGGQLSHQLSYIGNGLLGIAWEDARVSGKKRAYAQIIDTLGNKLWAANGVEVSNRAGDQVTPFVVSDGNGGLIVAWEDKTKGALLTDIYAQRLSSTASLLWSSAGVPVCTAGNSQQLPRILGDGQNGAIVTWEDYRPSFSNLDIYASRILSDGTFPVGPPILMFSSKTVAFGDVGLNKSSTKDITLTNTGGVPVTISSITSNYPQFSLTPDNSTIAPGGDVRTVVRFEPTTKDQINAIIVVESNSIFGPDTVRVSGRGTAAAAIQIDKSSLDFGNVVMGSTKSLAIDISNPGNDTLTISGIASSNPKFTVTITSRVLAPGASFIDSVRFSPTALGPVSANLTLTSSAPASPTIIPLTGAGVGVVTTTIDHANISFGDVAVGATKDTTLSITNTGNDTLRISSFTAGDSRFTMETPITIIAPNIAKTFTLRFAPNAAGPLNSVFVVASNALSSPDTISVDGVGVLNAAISFAPPQLSFGSVVVGKKEDLVLTINNTGGLPLTVSAISSTNPDFSALVPQFEVPGGGSFGDTIRFMPSVVSDRSGILIITSNAATSPDTVIVQGTGTDTSPVERTESTPGAFTLSQNYPNPFNPSTSIEFSIPKQGDVRLSVFDHLGREIAVLADGEYLAGAHTCRFDATEHTSGMYVYRLSFNGATTARKMLLLR